MQHTSKRVGNTEKGPEQTEYESWKSTPIITPNFIHVTMLEHITKNMLLPVRKISEQR